MAEQQAQEPPRAPRPRLWWLPKPILFTLFGALVSAWLVPSFTRQWQDRQKEREIKVELVRQMGDATSDALVTAQFIANRTFKDRTQDEFNRLAVSWAKRAAEIDARLHAYFPDSRVVGAWGDYSELVQGSFYLVTSDTGRRKHEALSLVRRAVAGDVPDADWTLLSPSFRYDDPRSFESYYLVSQAVLERRGALIRDILDANSPGFSTTTRDLLRDLLPFV